MAIRTWRGGDPAGDFSAATNWLGGLGLPVAGDTLIFNEEGIESITIALDTFSVANLGGTLAAVTVGEGYSGDLGFLGTPVDFGLPAGGRMDYMGSGAGHFASTGGNHPIVNIQQQDTAGQEGGVFYTGTASLVSISRGRLTVLAGATITTMSVSYITNRNFDAKADINNGASMGTLSMAGGLIFNDATLSVLNLGRGRLRHGENSSSAIGTIDQFGGIFDHRDGDVTGTYNGYAGLLIADNSGKARTVDTLNRHTGFNSRLDLGAGIYVITNDNAFGTGGGPGFST